MRVSTHWPSEKGIDRLLLPISDDVPIIGQYKLHSATRPMTYEMHFGLEFGIVLSGSMRRQYRDWSHDIGPGNVWFCGIWEPHGWSILKAPCKLALMVVHPQMLARMHFEEAPDFDALASFTAPAKQRPQSSSSTRSRVLDLGKRLWNVCEKNPPNLKLWLRLLLLESLILLPPENPNPRQIVSTDDSGRINRAIEAVYRERRLITADEAARLCGMSKNIFNKTFESIMGISFSKFALRYRISGAAAQLLQDVEEPLKVAAFAWGFTDASHLYQCFLRHFGCSPTDYRERMRRKSGTTSER